MLIAIDHSRTTRALAQITDAGAFERLATAVLRQANPALYGNLTHPGMNPDGKTKKSPVDGIAFMLGANPPHMIAAHHASGAGEDLRKKWLHEPSAVKSRRGAKPSAPAGDILKTIEIVERERQRTSELCVTLALTTNREPPEDLTRDVMKVASDYGITIDIWSCSRIADYLDTDPEGQWLRKQFLGIAEQRLSRLLLRELSEESINTFPLKAPINSLVDRTLDRILIDSLPRPVGFLVGESGVGKTVSCYKHLKQHIDAGGFGLVLTNEIVSAHRTFEQALDAELKRLCPSLESNASQIALTFCSSNDPFIIVVEDVNFSDKPAHLLERLVSWSAIEHKEGGDDLPNWRLFCPVWPTVIAMLSDEVKKRFEMLTISAKPFSREEACVAIKRRALLLKKALSPLDADSIASALGNDPLLIALYDFDKKSEPKEVIRDFVTNSLHRLANSSGSFTLTDYRIALRVVASAMLKNHRIDPSWEEIREWLNTQPENFSAFRQITQSTEIVRLNDKGGIERIEFRHDRVRAWLLTDTIAQLLQAGRMEDAILSEPFFSEVIGAALADPNTPIEAVERLKSSNTLALFYALKAFKVARHENHNSVLKMIELWLAEESTHGRANSTLRWVALQVLSGIESPSVLEITSRFRDRSQSALIARFRNGDLNAGIQLCLDLEPGVGAPWRDSLIEHAKLQFGEVLIQNVDELLKRNSISKDIRRGGLRLAGHLADPVLSDSIAICWTADPNRIENLADYLWAAAECCGDNPSKLLGPVCEAWAALPSTSSQNGLPSPRDDLAADHISWAFNKTLPTPALRYFIDRASDDDLRWPITYMLRSIDHPDAVEFIAHELAAISRRIEGTDLFSCSLMLFKNNWKRRQADTGKGMSSVSRKRLQELWGCAENDKHLRSQAFKLWATTSEPDDVKLLQVFDATESLVDEVLRARLERGDNTAIPTFLEKLRMDKWGNWWQLGRHIWSDELTNALDEAFQNRSTEEQWSWGVNHTLDHITSELLTRLKSLIAERLLKKHWHHLCFSPCFVQAALYVATPISCDLARESISQCPDPGKMLEHIHFQLGIKIIGHPGITDIRQLEVLVPYLEYIAPMDIHFIWDYCNSRGWFEFRRMHLDNRLQGQWGRHAFADKAEIFSELDKEVANKHTAYRVRFWIDDYIKQGEQHIKIFDLLREWAEERHTIAALEVVAEAIVYAGKRADIDLLHFDGIEPREQAEAIIANTRFAVQLRSLS